MNQGEPCASRAARRSFHSLWQPRVMGSSAAPPTRRLGAPNVATRMRRAPALQRRAHPSSLGGKLRRRQFLLSDRRSGSLIAVAPAHVRRHFVLDVHKSTTCRTSSFPSLLLRPRHLYPRPDAVSLHTHACATSTPQGHTHSSKHTLSHPNGTPKHVGNQATVIQCQPPPRYPEHASRRGTLAAASQRDSVSDHKLLHANTAGLRCRPSRFMHVVRETKKSFADYRTRRRCEILENCTPARALVSLEDTPYGT